jgi:hypothetical protein
LIGELPGWVKLFPDYGSEHLNGAFFATRLMQRPLDKLRYAARVLFVPSLAELRLVALPEFLAFLYYPLRPLRLLWKWGWGLLAGSMERGAESQRSDVRSQTSESREQQPSVMSPLSSR